MKNNWTLIIVLGVIVIFLVAVSFYFKTQDSAKVFSFEGFEGFEDNVMQEISAVSKSKIEYLTSKEIEDIDTNKYKIIKFDVKKEKRIEVLNLLRNKLMGSNYIPFYSKLSYDSAPESICVIKSNDKYDILRVFNTNGINYDVDTDALIEKLSKWDKELGIEIIGADYDWVDVTFNSLPNDMKGFSNEVYAFCPDSVDQGVGSLEELESYIKDNKEVFLWWD